MPSIESYTQQLQQQMLENTNDIPSISEDIQPLQPKQSELVSSKLQSIYGSDKLNTLQIARDNKELALRKDTTDYGNDDWLVESAKEFANEFLPHEYQIPVNKNGKRYNTENKIFNEDDLSNIWNKYEDNPAGNKTLYYLRKMDPISGQYVYKPGIAHVSAADRYKTQAEAKGWELIGEKRFDEASTVEKMIHGNKTFLEDRVYDYGSVEEQGAENIFGSGKSELYTRDILGIDTGTSEQYRANKVESVKKMLGLVKNERQAESTFEFIDAFQAGGINLAGNALKLIGEAVGQEDSDNAIEALGKSLKKRANQIAGYNPIGATEASIGLQRAFENKDPIRYIYNMAKGAPQWLAQSLPDMAAFAATSMATTGATGNPIAGVMAGSAVMGALRANDILDTREEMNDGRKATNEEVASVYAASSVLSMLEYGALKFAFTGKGLIAKDTAGKTINLETKVLDKNPSMVGELAKIIGRTATGTAEGVLAEGSEEVVSGLGEFLMTKYGTDKYQGQTIADLLTSQEAIDTAVTSFGAGGGAGGLAAASGRGISRTADAIKQKNADIILKNTQKLAEIKLAEEEAKQQAAQAEETIVTPSPMDEMYTKADDIQTNINTAKESIDIETMSPEEVKAKEVEIASMESELKATEASIIKEETEANVKLETELRTELKKAGKDDAYVDDYLNRIKSAGITNVLTLNDRKAGVGIQSMENTRVAVKGSNKPKTHDPIQITEGMLSDIVEGNFDKKQLLPAMDKTEATKVTDTLAKHFEYGHDTQIAIKEVSDKVSEAIDNTASTAKASLEAIIGREHKTSKSNALKIAALTMAEIKSGITSEYDVHTNEGVAAPKDPIARLDGMAEQLGKKYLNSYGLTLGGTAEHTARAYHDIGMKMIKFTEDAGLISTKEEAVVYRESVDESGKPIDKDTANAKLSKAQDTMTTSGKSKSMIKTKVATLVDIEGKGREPKSKLGSAMQQLSKLLAPSNYLAPTQEVTTEIPMEETVESTIDKKHRKIVEDYNKLIYNLKAGVVPMLEEIQAIINSSKYEGDIDKAFMQDERLKAIINVTHNNSSLTKKSEQGRSRSRQNNLRNLLDNLDILKNGNFHFNYEIAINQRLHVMQTVLDFQGDKYMARQLITGATKTTNKSNYKELLSAVTDATGLSEAELLSLATSETEGILANIDSNDGQITLANLLHYVKQLKSGKGLNALNSNKKAKSKFRLMANNPFKLMGVLQVLHDIRKAKGSKEITTDYAIEQDASASGAMNTLMNISGVEAVQKLLGRLGIGKYKTDKETDLYELLNESVMNSDKDSSFITDVKPTLDSVSKILEYSGMTLREVAKYPVMKWFYGQSDENAKDDMADSLAKDIILMAIEDNNQLALEAVNEITGNTYTIKYNNKNNMIKDILSKDVDKVVAYYKENLSNFYITKLAETFPGVVE